MNIIKIIKQNLKQISWLKNLLVKYKKFKYMKRKNKKTFLIRTIFTFNN